MKFAEREERQSFGIEWREVRIRVRFWAPFIGSRISPGHWIILGSEVIHLSRRNHRIIGLTRSLDTSTGRSVAPHRSTGGRAKRPVKVRYEGNFYYINSVLKCCPFYSIFALTPLITSIIYFELMATLSNIYVYL